MTARRFHKIGLFVNQQIWTELDLSGMRNDENVHGSAMNSFNRQWIERCKHHEHKSHRESNLYTVRIDSLPFKNAFVSNTVSKLIRTVD